MLVLEWFQPPPLLDLEWFGPNQKTLIAAGNSQTTAIAAVVGPRGRVGDPGPQGNQGQGVQDDPGDFTLIFENKLV